MAFLFLAAGMALANGCRKDGPTGVPACLKATIELNTCLVKVEEYIFRGHAVYKQVVGGCADYPTIVIDGKCNAICSCCGIDGVPSGPVEEFGQDAKFVRVVWER